MSDKTREDFEIAVCEVETFPEFHLGEDGDYEDPTVRRYWGVWQAATQHSAARIAELEAEVQALRECAVPPGCVVVPKEPTAEMLAAAAHISVCREDVYKAMLNAGQIITTPDGVAEWAQRLAIEAERTKP